MQGSGICCQLEKSASELKTVPECHYVSEASTSCMRDCCDISYDYYYMQPSLCCYIRQALTLGNQPSRAYLRVCLLLDVNKNTTLKQRVIKRCLKKWKPFFTQWSAWRCESRGTARLTGWLSFLTYTDGTQLSRAQCGFCTDDFCPLCSCDGSGMIGMLSRKKKTHVLGATERWTSSHCINIVHPWVRSPTLSQHLIPTAQGDIEVKTTILCVN